MAGGLGTTSKGQTSLTHNCPGGHDCNCDNWCNKCNLPKCRAHRDTKWADGTLNSTYKRDYDEKKGLGREPHTTLPGKEFIPESAPLSSATTHRQDFPPKHADMRASSKKPAGILAHRPFDGRTTYNTYHDKKAGIRDDPKAKAPVDYNPPFMGISSNNADYVQFPITTKKVSAPVATMPKVPFDGTSTYRNDFIKKAMPPKEPRAPPPLLPSNNQDNYTTYGTDFVALPFEKPRYKPCCHEVRHPNELRTLLREDGSLRPATPGQHHHALAASTRS